MSQNTLRAILFGCTGASGKALIQVLAKDLRYSAVKLAQRRNTTPDYGIDSKDVEKRFSQHVVDFEHLESHKDLFEHTDVCFCSLGTTLRKSGKEQMRIIDHDYVINIAELCAAAGCKQFHLVSSKGSNSSSMFFYLKLKGDVENDLINKNLSFEKLVIYRPAMLLCHREESRPFERLAQVVVGFVGSRSLAISVETLSQAMANFPFTSNLRAHVNSNVFILENSDIYSVASVN